LTKLPAIAFQGPRRRTAQSFEALGSSGLKYCLRDRGKGLLFFAHPATKLSRTDAANSGCTLKRHIERLHAALFFDKMKRGHQMISSHRCHRHFRSREHFGRVRRCRGLERCFRTLEFFRARDDRVPFPNVSLLGRVSDRRARDIRHCAPHKSGVLRLNPSNWRKGFLIVSKLCAPNLTPRACPALKGYPKWVCVQRLSQNGSPLETG
jgi:hypothetical protein